MRARIATAIPSKRSIKNPIVCQCFGTPNLEKKANSQSKSLSSLGAIWHHTTSFQCKLRSYFRKDQALQCTLPKQLPIVVRYYHDIIRQAMHKHPDPFQYVRTFLLEMTQAFQAYAYSFRLHQALQSKCPKQTWMVFDHINHNKPSAQRQTPIVFRRWHALPPQ